MCEHKNTRVTGYWSKWCRDCGALYIVGYPWEDRVWILPGSDGA